MLEQEAEDILEDYDGCINEFMTMAYMVKHSKRELVRGVINIDGSCRPQIVRDDHSLLSGLLLEIRKLTGYGILLNTSFNLHGEPLVCTPQDAVKTMAESGGGYMVIGDYLVTR